MILAGIWFGKAHPPINTFMAPLKESLLSLETTGEQAMLTIGLQ